MRFAKTKKKEKVLKKDTEKYLFNFKYKKSLRIDAEKDCTKN